MAIGIKAIKAFCPRLSLILAVLILVSCGRVHETTLANGLKIIVVEDNRAPVVVSQLWYRVGAQDEPKGLTGISHVLEHMMFKGTKNLKPNEFSRIIAENGGRENAFTGMDFTTYFQQLEKSRLAISFELEADRMQNLTLDPEETKKEIKVVMEERRLRTEDRPEGLLYEKFMAAAYQTHSYKNPVIGWMQDLENISVNDLREWYQRWYAPNNATLVVVGDVHPSEVFQLAEKYFGPIPARQTKKPVAAVEPQQKAMRRIRVSVPAKVPNIVLGYHVPVHTHRREEWEPYALDVLAGVLDGGESARFARELIRNQKIAASIDTGYSANSRSPTLFMFEAKPVAGQTSEDLEKAILTQIERLKTEKVTDEELQRVKAQVVAQDVYGRDSTFYQAMRIGMLETIGLNHRQIDTYVKKINAITAEQVQEVARRYLIPTNLTVAVLDPLPINSHSKPRPSMTGSRHGH